MGKEDNVMVFRDTEKLCKTNSILVNALKQAVAGQKAILETDQLPEIIYDRFNNDANVVVSGKKSYEAAMNYKGQRIAVHNFASATNPGGGVERGANAQEECLCRCSDLFFCLNTPDMWASFYTPHRNAGDPIHNDDIIFTPGVTVFKTDTAIPKLMDEKDWYTVDVITCAAPNLRERPSNNYNTGDGKKKILMKDSELLKLHEKRLKRILDVAVMQNVDTIILGAFGCGAFSNNPEVVALAAKNVVKNYLKSFHNIEFAIYCSPRDTQNYTIFERVLKPFTH